jgi:hypothetical protein
MIGTALFMLFTFLGGNPTLAVLGIIDPPKKAIYLQTYQIEGPYKVLDVLENKMGGKKLSEKAREKLFTLPEEQIRLIISLCERIPADGRSTGGDLAYLLVIALILLA